MAKKVKKLRTIIIKPAKVKPFNLSLEDKEENTRIVMALENLKVSAGWVFLMQLFEENKKILADMIIDKKDLDGKPIDEKQADEARYKHGYLKELMEKPNEYIKKLKPKTDLGDELDPYDQGETSEQ
jgi:hypothetical protein